MRSAAIEPKPRECMNLVIRDLSKTYPNGVRALRDVSLTLDRSETDEEFVGLRLRRVEPKRF